jgi:hypothetical protein
MKLPRGTDLESRLFQLRFGPLYDETGKDLVPELAGHTTLLTVLWGDKKNRELRLQLYPEADEALSRWWKKQSQ